MTLCLHALYRRVGRITRITLLASLTLFGSTWLTQAWTGTAAPPASPVSMGAPSPTPLNGRYLYTFPDGDMDIYAIDQDFALVQQVTGLPTIAGTRGVVVNPNAGVLYLSYGGDGGTSGNGSLLEYNLLTDRVVWTKSYSHGVDSMALSPDGSTIYMPDGEQTSDGNWYVVNASDGSETGTVINTGAGTGDCGPHNTLVSLDGTLVFLGDRNGNCAGSNYFYVANTLTNQITEKVGPFQSGIRPFTINGEHSLVYASVSGLLGFQVGDLTTGKVLYTVPVQGFTNVCSANCPSDPSHGVSLSPDETELYLVDSPNNYVHVFDVRNVPAEAPVQVANIPVTAFAPIEQPCAYDCQGAGWLLHSRAGDYVFVGDSGDVISTATRTVVTNLASLHNTRELIEIDWQNGQPVATTTRQGLGYVLGIAAAAPTSTVSPTAPATPAPTPSRTSTSALRPQAYLPTVP